MGELEQRIHKIISLGEGITTEFKTCGTQLNKNIYETVCAFLNRDGGTILLGVKDDGGISGIEPSSVENMQKDFVSALINPTKLSPAAYVAIERGEIEGKIVLSIQVPSSGQVHRCNGRIFDRNQDGDFDITDHTRLVAELYRRKESTYTENKIYPEVGLSDLRLDLVARCRKVSGLIKPDHPWQDLDDLELLKSAQLYAVDQETGRWGVTLAGILLLGKDETILAAVPRHRTDLILRKFDLDRYDDRDLVRTNLIESYERIMAFIKKHLPDPFFLDGILRISLRDTIFREIASNLLIHREYRNAFSARLIIENGQVQAENGCIPHGYGELDPTCATPLSKNPVIAAFFREIGLADELGSGMRKLMKYAKYYGGSNPKFFEGDVFKIVVTVPEFRDIVSERRAYAPENLPEYIPTQLKGNPRVERLLLHMQGELSQSQIMKSMRLRDRKNFAKLYLNPALQAGAIERTQPDSPTSPTQRYRRRS